MATNGDLELATHNTLPTLASHAPPCSPPHVVKVVTVIASSLMVTEPLIPVTVQVKQAERNGSHASISVHPWKHSYACCVTLR